MSKQPEKTEAERWREIADQYGKEATRLGTAVIELEADVQKLLAELAEAKAASVCPVKWKSVEQFFQSGAERGNQWGIELWFENKEQREQFHKWLKERGEERATILLASTKCPQQLRDELELSKAELAAAKADVERLNQMLQPAAQAASVCPVGWTEVRTNPGGNVVIYTENHELAFQLMAWLRDRMKDTSQHTT